VIVVKLGGRVQSDAALVPAIAEMWRRTPGEMCIVHGGGDEISALQRTLGREPSFVNGRRITSSDDIDLVRMVLSGSANKRLVSSLGAAGVQAVGISGEDGGLVSAEPIDIRSFGRSGKPVSASVDLLTTLLSAGFLPVISPVATDVTSERGEALNVNGDDTAAVIAAAMRAELWLVADVEGVLDANRELMKSIDPTQMESLVSDGTVNSGMRAKLEAGFDALAAGAVFVRIAGLDALTGKEMGTLLSLTPSMT
jgi:acetylglutamate kinase